MGEGGVPRSPKRLLWTKVEALELPPRPLNALHAAGIITLFDLVRHSEAELSVMKNIGKKDVLLLRAKLEALRLRIGMVTARRPRSISSHGKTRREGSSP